MLNTDRRRELARCLERRARTCHVAPSCHFGELVSRSIAGSLRRMQVQTACRATVAAARGPLAQMCFPARRGPSHLHQRDAQRSFIAHQPDDAAAEAKRCRLSQASAPALKTETDSFKGNAKVQLQSSNLPRILYFPPSNFSHAVSCSKNQFDPALFFTRSCAGTTHLSIS